MERKSSRKALAEIDQNLLDAMRVLMRQEVNDVKTQVSSVAAQLATLTSQLKTVQTSLQDCSGRVDTLISNFLPKVSEKLHDVSTVILSSAAVKIKTFLYWRASYNTLEDYFWCI